MCTYTFIAHVLLRLLLIIVVTEKGIAVISNLLAEGVRQTESGGYDSKISFLGQRLWN